jgi:arylsulfatase A-like enzyme
VRTTDRPALSLPVARPLWLALAAATLDALLNAHLYLRASPLGGDFALRPGPYLLRASYYGLWSHALVAAPFVWLGLRRARTHQEARCWPGALQIGITTALLLAGSLDREFQRFLGSHISAAWLATYAAIDHTPSVIWRALAEDRGGSWSAGVGLFVSLAYVPIGLLSTRLSFPAHWLASRARISSLVLFALVWPTVLWNFIPGGIQRQNKVRPVLLTLLHEWRRKPIHTPTPPELEQAVATYRSEWSAQDATHAWSFDDELFPLRKHFVGPEPESGSPPNFIVLSLETFRAKEMPSFRAGAPQPSPTPFLDQLAADPHSAYYPRYYSSGVPTVYAFMSIHTGLLTHPSRNVVAEATTQRIEGFPEALHRHGYYNVHFTGSDPDWDSQRVWLRRWYDEIDYRPDDGERDRLTFRRAATRLRELGQRRAPFLAYLSSISNHTPFHSPEPALDISSHGTAEDALRNTMHYTDDVVRELYESLHDEPWFARTIWIITGDHAFDLGERGEVLGHDNLRHETTWVPLILHGPDARLPRGRQERIASHIDLAPTLTELANVYDDNGYMGHSLLGAVSPRASALILRGPHYAYEAPGFSLYRPANGSALAYAPDDLVQEHAPIPLAPTELESADRLASATRIVLSYAIDFDRQTPRPEPRLLSRQ